MEKGLLRAYDPLVVHPVDEAATKAKPKRLSQHQDPREDHEIGNVKWMSYQRVRTRLVERFGDLRRRVSSRSVMGNKSYDQCSKHQSGECQGDADTIPDQASRLSKALLNLIPVQNG